MIGALDPIYVMSNRAEALLWAVIGCGFLVRAIRGRSNRGESLFAAITLIASDRVDHRRLVAAVVAAGVEGGLLNRSGGAADAVHHAADQFSNGRSSICHWLSSTFGSSKS
jgi:hypothetical protein